MADCECLAKCPFFNDLMKGMEGMTVLFKRRYCLGQFADCARYMVFKAKGRDAVPGDLFPNQIERTRELLGSSR